MVRSLPDDDAKFRDGNAGAGTAGAVGKLNTEAETAIAERYAVRAIPSMAMVRKVREIARATGAKPTSAIVAWVERSLLRV